MYLFSRFWGISEISENKNTAKIKQSTVHYRVLEAHKTRAVSANYRNYDAIMQITPEMKHELQWWIDQLPCAKKVIARGNPELILETDASVLGWGNKLMDTQTGGRFSQAEMSSANYNINVLKLLAIKLALQVFADVLQGCHVLVISENNSAVAAVKHMG